MASSGDAIAARDQRKMRAHQMTQGWRAKRAAGFAFFARRRSGRTEGQGETLTEEGERLNHEGKYSQGFERAKKLTTRLGP
jgi:hypothetical protein